MYAISNLTCQREHFLNLLNLFHVSGKEPIESVKWRPIKKNLKGDWTNFLNISFKVHLILDSVSSTSWCPNSVRCDISVCHTV